jgi:IS5 family transposase
MIEARRQQLRFGDGLIAEEVSDLQEDWMKHADQALEDEQLVSTVYEALARRRPRSRTRGRRGTPAEVVLRLLLLKHIRNWSYDVLEREVRANLVYRDLPRVRAARVPDAKSMGRWGLALSPDEVEKIHKRVVEIAQERQIVKGRKMRLDATVVETNIHYPTDSNLLGDGVRVLIRAMKRIATIAGEQGSQTAGSQSECEAAHSGNRAYRAHQGRAESGTSAEGIREALVCSGPSSRAGQAIFRRNR